MISLSTFIKETAPVEVLAAFLTAAERGLNLDRSFPTPPNNIPLNSLG
nr:MAG TPA: hypothetical protein [Crassvirales sp.]